MLFFSLFCLCWSNWVISSNFYCFIIKFTDSFLFHLSSLLSSPCSGFIILVFIIFNSKIFIWFFFISPIYLLRFSILFVARSFIIVHWSMLIMATLKSLSNNSDMYIILVVEFLNMISPSNWDFLYSWCNEWFWIVSWTFGVLCFETLDLISVFYFNKPLMTSCSHQYCQEGVGVLASNLTADDIAWKWVWRGASLPFDGGGNSGFSLGLHWQRVSYFFLFPVVYGWRTVVIINKISVLLVCPIPGSLAKENRLSLRLALFVSVGISGLWVSSVPNLKYLGGKKKAREPITVSCSSIPKYSYSSSPCLSETYVCFTYSVQGFCI